jgi:hypothetical protein
MSQYIDTSEISTNNLVPTSRLRHLADKIHRLGPRPLFQLLVELAEGADVVPALERYARLGPLAGFIADFGGDRLPPPVRLLGGRK